MYKYSNVFKAKSTFLKAVFSLFLLVQSNYLFSQTWDHSISKDFEFSIQDKWGESGLYTAKFVLSNAKTAFVQSIEIDDDNVGKLVFPDDFIQTRGKFNKDTITEFTWYVEVKKQKVVTGKIKYNPSPNTLLQILKYDAINFEKIDMVWGDVIDGYQWEDKNGKNIFIRSMVTNSTSNSVHLYIYHYLKEELEYKLVRKLTDYVKSCDLGMLAYHNIESIELTDINKDTVAEVSFSYSVDCSCIEDSLPVNTKLMLLTRGEKYAIRGTISPKKKQLKSEYEIGGNLLKNDLYRRFLLKKWKKLEGEQETIYN